MATTLMALADVSALRLQELVDEAVHFYVHVHSRCVSQVRDGQQIVGLEFEQAWRRMRAVTLGGCWDMRALDRAEVGEDFARVRQLWLFCPDDFDGRPGVIPPPTAFDPSRSQRFVMMEGAADFDDVDGAFTMYGAGHTTATRPGVPVLAQAAGTTLGGRGVFEGFDEGTVAYCGTLCPENGFVGNVLLRATDRRGLRTERLPPEFRTSGRSEEGVRYLIFRGQATPADPVAPRMGPDGRPAGLTVVQRLRGFEVDCWVRRHRTVQASDSVGPIVGSITAHVAFNPQAPGGGLLDPIPFATFDEFHFHDDGGRRIGGFTADTSEGRVFQTQVSGRPAIRFVGVGQIRDGDGVFAGVRGQMTDSSLVLFDPHVSASVYVLRLAGRR
jgi:hypothetical protein